MTRGQKIGFAFVGIAALWYGVLRGINAVKVTFDRLRIAAVNIGGITFDLSVLVTNPLLVDVVINDIVGDISLMDIPCAVVNYPVNQRLRACRKGRLNIMFDVFTSELTQALIANIQTRSIETLIMRFQGYVRIGNVKIPIDRQFTFNDIFGKR